MTSEQSKKVLKHINDHLAKHELSADHDMGIVVDQLGSMQGIYQIEQDNQSVHVTFDINTEDPTFVTTLVIPL